MSATKTRRTAAPKREAWGSLRKLPFGPLAGPLPGTRRRDPHCPHGGQQIADIPS